MSKRAAVVGCFLVLLAGAVAARWWIFPSPEATAEATAELPLPPFPPRITSGEQYESCLAALADDPAGAAVTAEAWLAAGGGEGATHCLALALVGQGKPEAGAAELEKLARQSSAPPLARAVVLAQAAQARLMFGAAADAAADASNALDLSPSDTELLILRASAEAMLERYRAALADLTAALVQDGNRPDALVSRAVMHRKLNELDMARTDVGRALALNPDDPDALLERGILRERAGDRPGARADWEHARGIDPNSTTADLAEQNLSLLEAGPETR